MEDLHRDARSRSLNEVVAGRLAEVARLLAEQDANPFRVHAYRQASETVRALPYPVSDLVQRSGMEGLDSLPGIGPGIARSIRDLLVLGHLPMLDRLREGSDPVTLLATVAGVGSRWAERLHHELQLDTLEELEIAAHDGRLAALRGIGEKRLQTIRDSLAQKLGRVRAAGVERSKDEASVAEVLDVDAEYRRKAAGGLLRLIAPKRFNPERRAWLPILHTKRGERNFTALFSNTPRAHALGKTNDWVVIYYDGAGREYQCTVITSEFGPLAGRRIVRGREPECLELARLEARIEARP